MAYFFLFPLLTNFKKNYIKHIYLYVTMYITFVGLIYKYKIVDSNRTKRVDGSKIVLVIENGEGNGNR